MSTFLFFPEGAFGPTNNCVGIGNALQALGHRVVFVVEASFAGTLQAKGFEERLVRLTPPPTGPEVPGQFWKDFVRDTSPIFRLPTIDQLSGFVEPTFGALCDGARYVDDQLAGVIDDTDPAVIVEDNVVTFPAILRSGRPWVRIMSCNPLEVPDPSLPPAFSGYPIDRRDLWPAFRERSAEVLGAMQAKFDSDCQDLGTPPLPPQAFIHESEWLNLALCPDEIDYPRSSPLPRTWHTLQASVRTSEPPWNPPPDLQAADGPLVYLSLGSLGSADLPLMRQLVDALSDTRYRVIVSKGPRHDELDLGPGMVGAEFLPQTALLPEVDAVITHGGNNTVTECLYFGKPMVVLPLFWDQPDNAQRVEETGFGRRLPTYEADRAMLSGALDAVLGDDGLAARLAATSQRLQANPGTVAAANLLEQLASTGTAVMRG